MVYPITRRVWQLEYLAVAPEFQSRGFGRLLIEAVIQRFKCVSVDCESSLISYYSRFGFRPLNRWLYYRSTATCVMVSGPVSSREKNLVYSNLSDKMVGKTVCRLETFPTPPPARKIPP